MLADLFEGAGLATVEAEAELQDLALAVVERGEEPVDLLGQERGGGHLEGRLGGAVLDDVAELGVAVFPQRLGERQRLGGEAQRLGDLVLRHLDLGRELGERGRAAQLQLEAGPGLLEAGQGVAGVDRQADRAAGVGDATGDRLADPPRGVGGELEALAPVELLDGVHQAEVALLDQVQERQARGLVLLGDRHDEAQVGLHEGALRASRPGGSVRRSSRLRAGVTSLPPASSSVRASLPASMAWARRTSSSLVSRGY